MTPVRTAGLAPDPGVPQRDLLLDPSEVAGRLAAALGPSGPIAIEDCQRTATKYRAGESLRVLYQVAVQGIPYLVSARTFRNGRSYEVYRRALDVVVDCGPLLPVVHDATLDTVFWTFPNDRRISGLALLSGGSEPLADLLGQPCRTRLVDYAPENSAVAQCLDTRANVIAYAKVFAGDDGGGTYAVHDLLAHRLASDHRDLRLPRPIVYLAAYRTLILEPIHGPRLADLDSSEMRAAVRRLGIAVGRFHTAAPPDVPRAESLDLDRLHHAARLLGQMCPDVGSVALDLAYDLTLRWEAPTDPLVCLHGDVNFRNCIITEETVGLVDLDSVSIGPAAADLGDLLAGLWYRHRIGQFSHLLERELAGAFLEGYASVRELPATTSLRWHTAAALLTVRALRVLDRLRFEAFPYLHGLLTDAHVILTGGADV